ncbi:MAG: hypothetical protein WBM02_03955 [bacterium]
MKRFKKILVDESVFDYPLTTRFLHALSSIPRRIITLEEVDARLRGKVVEASHPAEAKRTLLITRNSGSFLKYMGTDPDVGDTCRQASWRLDMFQGCPADCSYCFCQQYLSCHHVVAFVNFDDLAVPAFDAEKVSIVTGDIADSLALADLSIIAHHYISSFLPENCLIELRSKFCLPSSWRRLNPERFKLDWSLTPPDQWRKNEHGTSDPAQRIQSAATAAKLGYKVGIRLDPLQPDAIDHDHYKKLLLDLKQAMKPAQPTEFTIGSYKMSSELLEKIRSRFPSSPLPGYEWGRGKDGKLRPFKFVRLRSYQIIFSLIDEIFPGIPAYSSIEQNYVLNHLLP